jgi:TRAP-type mannitol/chloroaromatic compound transport system substrate-binding protein
MKRRQFLASIGVIPIAAPAIAQPLPEITWRLAASWPKSLDTLYGACEVFAKRVGEVVSRICAASAPIHVRAHMSAWQSRTHLRLPSACAT